MVFNVLFFFKLYAITQWVDMAVFKCQQTMAKVKCHHLCSIASHMQIPPFTAQNPTNEIPVKNTHGLIIPE